MMVDGWRGKTGGLVGEGREGQMMEGRVGDRQTGGQTDGLVGRLVNWKGG